MLTRGHVTDRLTDLLRNAILDGSDRDIENGISLGEEGVGLDSLALVQFLTAVEKEFDTAIPVEIWSRIDQMSLDDCAEAVLGAAP